MKIKNRHRLKNKKIREYQQKLKDQFNENYILEDSIVETGVIDEYTVLLVDNEVDFILSEDYILFTLHGLYRFKPERHRVVVDMGAVKFVINGADIMAAGIVDADESIVVDDQVWICDETHHKPLAVGFALVSGEEMVRSSSGKAVKNVHFVGDILWKMTSS